MKGFRCILTISGSKTTWLTSGTTVAAWMPRRWHGRPGCSPLRSDRGHAVLRAGCLRYPSGRHRETSGICQEGPGGRGSLPNLQETRPWRPCRRDGTVFRTRTGNSRCCSGHEADHQEPSASAGEVPWAPRRRKPLSPAIRGPYCQRGVRSVFIKRARIIQKVREFLAAHGFLEVETPMMQPSQVAPRPVHSRPTIMLSTWISSQGGAGALPETAPRRRARAVFRDQS